LLDTGKRRVKLELASCPFRDSVRSPKRSTSSPSHSLPSPRLPSIPYTAFHRTTLLHNETIRRAACVSPNPSPTTLLRPNSRLRARASKDVFFERGPTCSSSAHPTSAKLATAKRPRRERRRHANVEGGGERLTRALEACGNRIRRV